MWTNADVTYSTHEQYGIFLNVLGCSVWKMEEK